jgi:hypothetical protein
MKTIGSDIQDDLGKVLALDSHTKLLRQSK